MNRKRKLKHMKKFIDKYGLITCECKRPPDPSYPPYRKGSYFAGFISEKLDMCCTVGDINKYRVYKEIFKSVKYEVNKNQQKKGE